jgi:hypothetical protein
MHHAAFCADPLLFYSHFPQPVERRFPQYIGLVQQPGWLFHKSRRFGGFLAEIRQICRFSAEVVQ